MRKGFKIGSFELTWLDGGRFELDGGTMFGAVPKVLWSKKYPADAENYIPISASPLLVKTPTALCIIDSGLGNKLSKKEKGIFRVREEWNIAENLRSMGIRREDIDLVLLTHYDFDHSGGVVMADAEGVLSLTFPKAKHIIQQKEWEDVLSPDRRTVSGYWPVNHECLKDSPNLELIAGEKEVAEGIRVISTGGHSRGHQIVALASDGEKAIHPGDLIPTHIHYNPLWVMAYDNFPLEAIARKEEIEKTALSEDAWLLFYHDPFLSACKFDEKGNLIEKW